jgi:hypothetical protein
MLRKYQKKMVEINNITTEKKVLYKLISEYTNNKLMYKPIKTSQTRI